jgi:uncharacterized protein
MRFVVESDARELAGRVRPFLEARIECNVLATVLLGVLDGRYAKPAPVLAFGVDDGGEVGGVALRTPPLPMLCSDLDLDAAVQLVEFWLAVDPQLPGVSSLSHSARAVARAWEQQTGGSARCQRAMALHSLTRVVDPPRPAGGSLVRPSDHHHDLLVTWWTQFAREAGVTADTDTSAPVQDRVQRHGIWLWEDPDGVLVSMVAVNPAVANVVRIGPVYTPPEHRGHGYASSAVAAVSREALDRDADTCMLFTDRANPTSNKIYADVGYQRFADWEEHEFTDRE